MVKTIGESLNFHLSISPPRDNMQWGDLKVSSLIFFSFHEYELLLNNNDRRHMHALNVNRRFCSELDTVRGNFYEKSLFFRMASLLVCLASCSVEKVILAGLTYLCLLIGNQIKSKSKHIDNRVIYVSYVGYICDNC